MLRCDGVCTSEKDSSGVRVLGNVEKVNRHQSGNVYSPLSLSEHHGRNARIWNGIHPLRKTVLIVDILRRNRNRKPYLVETDVATSLLSRDYKGLSNYTNGVVEIWRKT